MLFRFKYFLVSFILLGGVGFLLVGYFHFAHAQAPWYDTDFQYRQKVTVNSGQVANVGITQSRVSQSSDDAEECLDDGNVDLSSSDLELISETGAASCPSATNDQRVGLRFQNIDIPQGATITSAFLEFETDETTSSSTSLTFQAQDADNASTFTTTNGDVTSRTVTSASVDWNNVPAWDMVDEKHQTPDVSSIVQEVVDRGGWSSGNSLAVIVSGSGERIAESFDGEAGNAPLLRVEHSGGASETTLTDFPVYQDLSEMQTGFFSNVQSDGADIRITEADGTTEIAREVVAIDTSGNTGELHFKAPSLSSGSDTEFYIYYGNPNASAPTKDSTYGSQNVWTNGYEAVYHFQEDPTPPENLITNPGAENNVTGWTNTGSANYATSAEVADLAPFYSPMMFYPESGSEALLHQDVDLLAAGYTTSELDSGNTSFQFSGYQANAFTQDTGQLIMEFRDGGGAVLATETTPLQEITPEDIFERVSVTGTAPTGTRTIRVQQRAVLVGGSFANVAFDNLYLNDVSNPGRVVRDSTVRGNHGSARGGMTSANSVTGQLTNGFSFDGVDDFIYVPNSNSLNFGAGDMTISIWNNRASLDTRRAFLDKYISEREDDGYRMGVIDNPDTFTFTRGLFFADAVSANDAVTQANAWQTLTTSVTGETVSFFVDGGGAGGGDFPNSGVLGGPTGMTIAGPTEPGSDSSYIDATLDEIRIASSPRSQSWISTKYNNQSAPATFTTASPEEQVPADDNTTGEMSSPNYTMLRSSINAGGREDGTSANYGLTDTLGQSTPPGGQSSTTYDLQAGYRKMVAQETAIVITSPDDVELTPDISGVSGGTGNGQVTWTTTTNNPDGYELSIKADSDPALQNMEGDVFEDYVESGEDRITMTPFQNPFAPITVYAQTSPFPNHESYVDITIPASNVDTTITDFPVYVDLSDLPNEFWNNTKNNGGDIRVADTGGNEKPRELVDIDIANQTGELHLKQASLSSTSDNVIRIYFDNASANDYADSATYGAENVWTNGYEAVWHMNEDPSNGANAIVDSTGNGNNGDSAGTMTASDSVSGVLSGNALDFNGSNDYLKTGQSDIAGDITLTYWANFDQPLDSPDMRFAAGVDYDGANTGWEFKTPGGSSSGDDTTFRFQSFDGTAHGASIPQSNFSPSTWTYIGGTCGAGTWKLYKDGSDLSATQYAQGICAIASNETRYIGSQNTGTGRFHGRIDEMRLSSVERNSAWIATEYDNQNDSSSFYTVGSVEDNTATNPPSSVPDYNFSFDSTESVFGFTPEGVDIIQRFRDDGTSCNTGSMDTSGRCWVGFTTTDEIIAESTSAKPDGIDTTVKFRAAVGNQTLQPPGEYEATVTATAVVK